MPELSKHKKKLLSERTQDERILIARQYARQFGWKEIEATETRLTFEKTGYVAIPDKVLAIWDANECSITTILFHETRKRWSVLTRWLFRTRPLFHILGYPRTHVGQMDGVERTKVRYYKDFEKTKPVLLGECTSTPAFQVRTDMPAVQLF